MVCKCGATVKPGRVAGDNPFSRQRNPIYGRFRNMNALGDREPVPEERRTGPPASPRVAESTGMAWPDSSELREDRGRFERGQLRIRGGMTLAAALEQHPPFEGAGTHIGEALEHLFPDARIMGGHQSDRLDQARVQSRFAPGLLQKDLAIKGPMFGADVGKPDIGIEIAARDIA